jgi:hypothetical protein
VRLELSGAPAVAQHPDIALLVETVPACEEAYYREFRRQGLQLSATELRAHSLNPERSALDFLSASVDEGAIDENASGLHKVWIEHGWAWVEQLGGRWRELRLSLQELDFTRGSPAVLQGMMGNDVDEEAASTEDVSSRAIQSYAQLSVEPEDAAFDLRVLISRVEAPAGSMCSVDVIASLHDRFGDYSGVDVHLRLDAEELIASTDIEGVAHFPSVPCHALRNAYLVIRLPA